jgi:hypothetical protein
MDKAKRFDISKREVWEAFKQVKENHGAAGVDGQSIAQFEEGLSNNLYPYSPMTEFVSERVTAELLSLETRLSVENLKSASRSTPRGEPPSFKVRRASPAGPSCRMNRSTEIPSTA